MVNVNSKTGTEVSSPSWKELLCRRSQTAIVAVDAMVGAIADQRFEILALIGTGTCSKIYKAREVAKPDRLVALKLLHSDLLSNTETVARFQREAKSGASLNHPNICAVYEYGHLSTRQPYIAMEYLEGESLSSLLRRTEYLSVKDALPIFIACCGALMAAHEKGIIHRDIKPANIFVRKSGPGQEREIKLLDFGLAKVITCSEPKLTLTGTTLGTVQYMSPEQILSEPIDPRADIYSLACVMYETLTGRKVFDGKSALEVMDQHLHKTPRWLQDANPSAKIGSPIENIVLKALSKEPARRYQNAEELKMALENILDGLIDQPSHHNVWPWVAFAVIVLTCLVLAVR